MLVVGANVIPTLSTSRANKVVAWPNGLELQVAGHHHSMMEYHFCFIIERLPQV